MDEAERNLLHRLMDVQRQFYHMLSEAYKMFGETFSIQHEIVSAQYELENYAVQKASKERRGKDC